MDKSRHFGPRPNVFLFLAKDGMTEIAIFGNDFAVFGFMIPTVKTHKVGLILHNER
jgi:hypothetical protein